ncbi:MAG: HAD family hydrolase [Bdellovibrionaceae bacterium]|nr:HAD family hydrolase [Pseudobdellovibrionaceae bacterium]
MKSFNHKYDCILLDLDGTLVESRENLFLIYNAFRLYQRFSKLFGFINTVPVVSTAIKAMLKNEPGSGKKNYDVLLDICCRETAMPKEKIEWELEQYYQKDFLKWQSLFTAVPGAQKFVQQAKGQGKRLYIWTNPIWPEFNVKKRLEWAGYSVDDFAGFTHSQNAMACKPNVSYYVYALQLFDLDPQSCILIGDSELKDGPARLAGIETAILSQDKLQSWQDLSKRLL